MSLKSDILIIGAGSSGSAIAYYLAKKGVKNITVLEKVGIGSGATGHAAGLIRHHYVEREIVKMMRYCSKKLSEFKEEMGFEIDYFGNKFCYLTPANQEGIEDVIAMQREEGVNVELLTPSQLAHIHPKGEINTDGVGYGLLDHDASYADPYKVAVGYCERAKQLGVKVQVGVEVIDLETKAGKVSKVITNKGEYEADLVINAAGLGADKLNKILDIHLPMKNFSLGHGVLIPDIPFEPNIITINDASDPNQLFFLRPESGGTVLIGMDQDDPNRDFNPDTYYMDAPFDKIGKYYEHIVKRLPFVKGFKLSTAFGALDVKTPDWNPGVGFLDGAPENYYQVIAGSGHAFKLAPAIGKVVSEEILGESQSFDFTLFDINRLLKFSEADFSGSFFIND